MTTKRKTKVNTFFIAFEKKTISGEAMVWTGESLEQVINYATDEAYKESDLAVLEITYTPLEEPSINLKAKKVTI